MPSLQIQREIERALDSVQQTLHAREIELALERERKAALMHHLFNHGTRGEPTKHTEIGEIPESWEVEPLGRFILDGPQNGVYKHHDDYSSGTYIVRINDFDNDGAFVTNDFQRVCLTPVESEKYRLSEHDNLVNRVNSLSHLGKAALVPVLPEVTVFESNMMRLRVNGEVLRPGFLLRFLTMPNARNRMRQMAKLAVAQASINQGDLTSLLAPIPSLKEQRAVEEALDAQDSVIQALSCEVVGLTRLLQAMLEELMTGSLPVCS